MNLLGRYYPVDWPVSKITSSRLDAACRVGRPIYPRWCEVIRGITSA